MKKNNDLFAKDENDLGRTNVLKHRINTENTEPIKQRAYRCSKEDKEETERQIKDLLEKGIVKRSHSPWSSPIVFVAKKNGKRRMCIDYRKINNVTKKDNHPLPRIDELLDTFEGKKWFTSLDLASGYWQVPIEEKDKEKTAFITHEGLYEFEVMPFGLCNAPATFQRMMHIVLGESLYKTVLVYIDDVIIYSETFEEHMIHIKEVFKKLRKTNLKIRAEKCSFAKQEIEFLGHIIGKDGIKVNEKLVEKVKNFPRPKSVTELRGFLGLASYYRRFIKDFAKVAKPLNELLKGSRKKKSKWKKKQNICEICNEKGHYEDECLENKGKITGKWTNKQEESFEILKEKLTNAPIIKYPNWDKEFILHTDASGFALGEVLSQKGESEKDEHVIAYASKSLTESERKWSTTELECLAIIWAVEKFHYYLAGRKFKIITDHYALKWLKENALKGRLARWILRLQPYDFEIIYKEGKKHKNADALSRIKF